MLSPRNAFGIFIYVNIISWLMLLFIKLIAFLGFGDENTFTVDFYLRGLLLNFVFLFSFFFFSANSERKRNSNFIGLLSSLFVFGLVSTIASLLIQLVISLLEIPPVSDRKALIMDVLYHINILLVTVFLTRAFFYWKQMVLHQNKLQVQRFWDIFEYTLLVSLLFNFFDFDLQHPPFILALSGLLILAFILSFNLKWVAYLNAREKWQGILLLLLICVFAFYFFRVVISHSFNPYFSTDLMHSVYVLAIFIFVIFYSIFSLLVIIFNLPTTAVFEKKIEEVLSFQRLTQSLQAEDSEEQVYNILLKSVINSQEVDAAWLEVLDEQGNSVALLKEGISQEDIQKVKGILKRHRLQQILEDAFAQKESQMRVNEALNSLDYNSVYTVPLIVNQKSLGNLTLLSRLKNSFEEEKKELINTYVRQASISIENFRLLRRTIEAERYKEEIKIAQTIQKRLLPTKLELSEALEIEAFSESAYEVGGDYYDVYRIREHKLIFVVGDVSGKGTTAAFHMAQMKGIFQALAQMHFDPERFLEYANNALSNCLSRASFITLTLISVDLNEKTIEFARAGHCPTLYYSARDRCAQYYKGKGLGLGIIRDPAEFYKHIETQQLHYHSGDLVLLYTDGIVEARGKKEQEYGYERLQQQLEKMAQAKPKAIMQHIINDVHDHTLGVSMADDYTALLIKFK